jgi:hypothetical protein
MYKATGIIKFIKKEANSFIGLLNSKAGNGTHLNWN